MRWLRSLMAGVAVLLVTGLGTAQGADHGLVVHTAALATDPGEIGIATRTGRAFVVNTGANTVGVFSTQTGRLLRTVAVGTNPIGAAVDEQTGRVFVANLLDNTISVLDARSGQVVRTVPVGTMGCHGLPVTVDARTSRVFVRTEDGSSIALLDAYTGAVLRRVWGVGSAAMAVDARTGRIYALGQENVSVLDGRNGTVLRQFPISPAPQFHHIAISARTGRLFLGGYQGLGVLDAASGRVVAARRTGVMFADMVVDEQTERVFLATARGSVSVLDARSGRVVRTIASDINGGLILDAPHDRVFATGKGMLVLDARSGTVRRLLLPRRWTEGVAVDQRTGHVLISSISWGRLTQQSATPGGLVSMMDGAHL